jgi:hypothetical protein
MQRPVARFARSFGRPATPTVPSARSAGAWRGSVAQRMNFFGHAHVAGWFSEAGPFVLGSMLPDFANVLGVAPPRTRHAELHAGIELHHETDRVFHDCDAFCELEQDSRENLAALGVSKGPRRALAHIGVELLIDAELARLEPVGSGYTTALRYGMTQACGGELEWRASDAHSDQSQRLAGLCSRLATSSRFGSDAGGLARRLMFILASRPRLQLQLAELAYVEAWLADCKPRVAALIQPLLSQLGQGLGASPDAWAGRRLAGGAAPARGRHA